MEITANFIEFDGKEFTCTIVRDIRRKKVEEDLLRTVSEAISGLTGHDLFVELAKKSFPATRYAAQLCCGVYG